MIRKIKDIFSQEFIDNTISGGINGQFKLLAIVILGILTIVSVVICGLDIKISQDETIAEQLWVIYNSFIDSGNLVSQTGFANRLVLTITSLFGSVLLGGVFISMCSNIIERRVEVVQSGKAYYRSIKNHYVIIGYSNIAISLIKEIHKECPDAKIIVMSSKESGGIRHKLQSQLRKDEERKVYVYFGNIDSVEELERLNINYAKEVYVLGEEGEYGRDSKNIQCVHRIQTLYKGSGEKCILPVYTQFDRLSIYSVIQKFDIMNCASDGIENLGLDKVGKGNIYFRPFNLYENWARRLWSVYSVENEYEPLDFVPISLGQDGCVYNKDKYVHLVIVGFGGMGQALLLEALRICHYANYDDLAGSEIRVRTKISVVDKNIEELKEQFCSQYPYIEQQIDDILIDYVDGDVSNYRIRENIKGWAGDRNQLLTLAICISDPDQSINLGLNLPWEVYSSEARILIRQEIQTDLGLIVHRDKGRYRHVKIFGMLDDCISKNMLNDTMSAFINQEYEDAFGGKSDNKEYIKSLYVCRQKNDVRAFEKEVERARKSWIGLEENMRWANRYQIDAYPTFLRTLGCEIIKSSGDIQLELSPEEFKKILSRENLFVLMRMEKHRWNAERSIEGWRYGPVRDDVHRIHDKLVPYHRLDDCQKYKDEQVINNLPYLIYLMGYRIKSI